MNVSHGLKKCIKRITLHHVKCFGDVCQCNVDNYMLPGEHFIVLDHYVFSLGYGDQDILIMTGSGMHCAIVLDDTHKNV